MNFLFLFEDLCFYNIKRLVTLVSYVNTELLLYENWQYVPNEQIIKDIVDVNIRKKLDPELIIITKYTSKKISLLQEEYSVFGKSIIFTMDHEKKLEFLFYRILSMPNPNVNSLYDSLYGYHQGVGATDIFAPIDKYINVAENSEINDDSIPFIPPQSLAPIMTTWIDMLLTLDIRYPTNSELAVRDGREANLMHLREEGLEILEMLSETNAGRFVQAPLNSYLRCLEPDFESIDIMRVGHKGISLRSAVRGSEELLLDHHLFRLNGFIASHELFLAQDDRWKTYISAARSAGITAKEDGTVSSFAKTMVKQLFSMPNVVDPQIPHEINASRDMIDCASSPEVFSSLSYGYYGSIRNTLISILRVAVENSVKPISDLQKDVRQEARKIAISTFVKASGAALLALAVGGITGFEWLEPVLKFLFNSKPPS